MMSRKNKNRWPTAVLNNATFNDWYNYLANLAMNSIKWEGLPDTVDPRFLELTLFERGYALFYQDDVMLQFIALPCDLSGTWDIYNIPIQRRAFASNGYHYDADKSNSVIIWNNYEHTNMIETTRLYSLRLYELERTIDTNVKGQKYPVLIKAPEKQRLVMKNVYMEYDGNCPIIFADDFLNTDGISVLNTQSPYVADKLFQLKQNILNEYLTKIGIENSNNQKKERMVSDEVGSNYGSIEASRNIRLNARQQACDEINKMFGLDVSVRYNSDLPTLVNGLNDPMSVDEDRSLEEDEIVEREDE